MHEPGAAGTRHRLEVLVAARLSALSSREGAS
jgi:hypothetical protein